MFILSRTKFAGVSGEIVNKYVVSDDNTLAVLVSPLFS